MRKTIFFYLLFISYSLSLKAQLYSFGGTSQLYWTWRPDIGNDCYEFTYESYIPARSTTTILSSRVSMYYWNECSYGKAWIGASDTGFINEPLHDTLYKEVPPFGIVDTFCGFDAPYKKAQASLIEPYLSVSPHRKKLVYKGIVCLPEKCKWYFAIGSYKNVCTDLTSDRAPIQYNFPSAPDTFRKSNMDFKSFVPYYGNTKTFSGPNNIVGCSFNNTDYPNNSSVRFLSPAIYYFPIHKGVEYSPGPYDPDHDSIVISIRDTIKAANWIQTWSAVKGFFRMNDSSGNPYPYAFTWNGYFAPLAGQSGPNPIRYNAINNPFDTDSTFHLIDSTGKTSFNAQSIMYPVLYYSAKEYRNNQLLSESYFFTQFALMDDPRPISYIKVDTSNVQGILSFNNQGTFMGCAGYPISFDACIKLPSVANGNLIVWTTADSTLPGNGTCAFNGMNTDSVNLKLNWTPPSNARGLYNVYVVAKDSNCDPPYNQYTQVYTWSFYIDGCVIPLNITALDKEEDNVVLYPNPANDKLMISSEENFSSIKIYSLLSQLLYEKKTHGTKKFEVHINDLPTGMYLVNIDGKYIRKLLIER